MDYSLDDPFLSFPIYDGILPPTIAVANITVCEPIIRIVNDTVYEGEEALTLSSHSDVNIRQISSSTTNYSIVDAEGTVANH